MTYQFLNTTFITDSTNYFETPITNLLYVSKLEHLLQSKYFELEHLLQSHYIFSVNGH
jgi:hypothetical protein